MVYAPWGLKAQEVESVGFTYLNPTAALQNYPIESLKPGFNNVNGEEIYYIENPALGLWALKSSFDD